MKFTEFEQIMEDQGVGSLAEIARIFESTPQAVSNWKARDQVPQHIVAKISNINLQNQNDFNISENNISLSDILLTIAEQLKVILITTFISVFLTFTYVQFVKPPQYISWATLLLPENKSGSMDGLAGLASQFGVNMPFESSADLSSPSLYPDILKSRTFAEKILYKEFYLEKYEKKLTLLQILTDNLKLSNHQSEVYINEAVSLLNSKYLNFEEDATSPFSILRVTASEPIFAKELAEVVLVELDSLNRFFKSQTVSEKNTFIENRIATVQEDLESSEISLKEFNEKNRQISSPALQLELERLERNAEVQKGIYLTLKQQLELSKIEEVQEASIVQILDEPQVSINPSNKNLILSVFLSAFFGVLSGIIIGFVRSYLDNSNIEERKKLRRVKHFFKKKTKEIILDRRISGIISIFLIIGLPFYLGYESKIPVFFGRYSTKLMILIIIYSIILVCSSLLFIYATKKRKNAKEL